MTPDFSHLDIANKRRGYAVLSREPAQNAALSRNESGFDRENLGLGQLGRTVLAPLSRRHPALEKTVIHVLGLSSEEKVSWVHTPRIVAAVQDIHASGYWSIGQFPSRPMSKNYFIAVPEIAVTAVPARSNPNPASRGICNRNLTPEKTLSFIHGVIVAESGENVQAA